MADEKMTPGARATQLAGERPDATLTAAPALAEAFRIDGGGDPSASRAFLDGRLSADDLAHYRQEIGARTGLSAATISGVRRRVAGPAWRLPSPPPGRRCVRHRQKRRGGQFTEAAPSARLE